MTKLVAAIFIIQNTFEMIHRSYENTPSPNKIHFVICISSLCFCIVLIERPVTVDRSNQIT